MPDFDFPEREDRPSKRRHIEEDDDSDEPNWTGKTQGELILFSQAVIAALVGGLFIFRASTILHEILAAQCFVMASVLFAGGMIYGAVKRR